MYSLIACKDNIEVGIFTWGVLQVCFTLYCQNGARRIDEAVDVGADDGGQFDTSTF